MVGGKESCSGSRGTKGVSSPTITYYDMEMCVEFVIHAMPLRPTFYELLPPHEEVTP